MSDKKPQLRTLVKGLEVLEMLQASTAPLSLTELAELTQDSKPAVFRVLHTLEERGYVSRRERDKRYIAADTTTVKGTAMRLISLLESISACASSGGSLPALAAKTGMDQASVAELLEPLVERGLVEAGYNGAERWRISMRVLELLSPLLAESDLATQAAPIMERLSAATGETLSLFYRDDYEHVLIAVQPSRQPVRYVLDIGQRFALHLGGAGKAELAFIPQLELDQLLQQQSTSPDPLSPAAIERLHQDLQQVRQQGYAISVGERIEGATAVAAPIFAASGAVCGVMSIMMPSFRADQAQLHQMGRQLIEALQEIFIADAENPAWPGSTLTGDQRRKSITET